MEEFYKFLEENNIKKEFIEEIANYEGIELECDTENEEIAIIIEEALDSAAKEIFDNTFLFFYEGQFANSVTDVEWDYIRTIYLDPSKKRTSKTTKEKKEISMNLELDEVQTSYSYLHSNKQYMSLDIGDRLTMINKTYEVFKKDIKRSQIRAKLINKSGKVSKNKYIVIADRTVALQSNGDF